MALLYYLVILALIFSGYGYLYFRRRYLYIAIGVLGSQTAFGVVAYRLGTMDYALLGQVFIIINASFLMVSLASSFILFGYSRLHQRR